MIYLGLFSPGDTVFYAENFHSDQMTIADPTGGLEAQLRTPAGVWSDLTAPSKQNGKTGHYGGTVDTTDFAAGQYVIRMAGTVATAKTTATEFTFTVNARVDAFSQVITGTRTAKGIMKRVLAFIAGERYGGGQAGNKYFDDPGTGEHVITMPLDTDGNSLGLSILRNEDD